MSFFLSEGGGTAGRPWVFQVCTAVIHLLLKLGGYSAKAHPG